MTFHQRILLIALCLWGGAVPVPSDVRNLSWLEMLDFTQSACVGRIAELRSEPSDPGDDVIVARATLIEAVAGSCPTEFMVQSSDIWEVLQRPHELGYDYLFFLPDPIPEGIDRLPRFEVSHRLIWKQLGYEACYGKELETFYDPRYVNLPDHFRTQACIVQRIPHVGTLTHSAFLVTERLLFDEIQDALSPK